MNPSGVWVSNTTCKDVNLASGRVRIAQSACEPQYNHRVGGHNVAHMLIKPEVL